MDESPFPINKKRLLVSFGVILIIYIILFLIDYSIGNANLTLDINNLLATSPSWFQILMYYYTQAGYFIFDGLVFIYGIIVFVHLDKHRSYVPMILGSMFGSFLGSLTTDSILKPIIAESRPFVQYPSKVTLYYSNGKPYESGGYSMPSGHATEAFSASSPLMVKIKKWIPRIIIYFYAISLSFTRPFFAQHFVSDILVGSIVGTCCGLVCFFLLEYLIYKFKPSDKTLKILFIIAIVVTIAQIWM